MNTTTTEYKSLENYGKSLIGKTAQSRLLTELDGNGKQKISAPAKITAYEIVETFQKPTLMVTLDGESVFEETLFNISESVFSISEGQLEKLVEKVQDNIKTKLDKKGEYSLSVDLSQSVSDTIKSFLKKHCCK